MSNKYDYWFGLVIAITVILANAGTTYDMINILIEGVSMNAHIGGLLYAGFYASISLLIILLCIGFIIYNFIKRKAEITYRGSLVVLSTHSFSAGLFTIADLLYNHFYFGSSIDAGHLINALLVILTGGFMISAAFSKYAANGRKNALWMSCILCGLYVIDMVMDLAQGRSISYVYYISMILGYFLMAVLAYKRKTYVLDY